MKLIKKVPIKLVVTEESKEKIRQNFTNHKLRLEQECQQLQFEIRKLKNKNANVRSDMETRFNQEIKNRQEKMKLLDFKIEQLDELKMGSEIVEKEVEALVEVEVGSDWNHIMKEQAIVIKDDKVIRIDE
ncbi:YlqD family protein [Oceanobacillus jeddahense]|uniref:YlqD family protein n=1 Tax=Oceanobacillus jeddahense TaxID=1462527 RepID=A0ABY5JMM9_9BACI|nr:YlqD family protein [Oceanobacillus jeddahense]UUI01562.1 YlqD family protein [Oceanobacillus jeddahense]